MTIEKLLFEYYKNKPIGNKASFYYILAIEFNIFETSEKFEQLYNDIVRYQINKYDSVLYDKYINSQYYLRRKHEQIQNRKR